MWGSGLGPTKQESVVLKEIEEKYTALQLATPKEKTMFHLWINKQINWCNACGNV